MKKAARNYRIRGIVPFCRLIPFSGQAATVDLLAQARQQGHRFDMLPKPIKPEQLIAVISVQFRLCLIKRVVQTQRETIESTGSHALNRVRFSTENTVLDRPECVHMIGGYRSTVDHTKRAFCLGRRCGFWWSAVKKSRERASARFSRQIPN